MDALEAAIEAATVAEREAAAALDASVRASAAADEADEALDYADEAREAMAPRPEPSCERCEAPTSIDCGDGTWAPSTLGCDLVDEGAVPATPPVPSPPEQPDARRDERADDPTADPSGEALIVALRALAATRGEHPAQRDEEERASGWSRHLGFVVPTALGGALVLLVLALRRRLQRSASA